MAAEGHGGWHALLPAAGREQVFLVALVALELGDEVADDGSELGGGDGLFPGGRPGQQFGGFVQPDVIPGKPGRCPCGGVRFTAVITVPLWLFLTKVIVKKIRRFCQRVYG